MTIEVLTVQNPTSGFRNNRPPEEVAAEIQAHYTEVAERGGRIIASHVLDVQEATETYTPAQTYKDSRGREGRTLASSYIQGAYKGSQCLFLVADIPDAT